MGVASGQARAREATVQRASCPIGRHFYSDRASRAPFTSQGDGLPDSISFRSGQSRGDEGVAHSIFETF